MISTKQNLKIPVLIGLLALVFVLWAAFPAPARALIYRNGAPEAQKSAENGFERSDKTRDLPDGEGSVNTENAVDALLDDEPVNGSEASGTQPGVFSIVVGIVLALALAGATVLGIVLLAPQREDDF